MAEYIERDRVEASLSACETQMNRLGILVCQFIKTTINAIPAADAIEELIIKLNHADEQIEKLVEVAEERCWIPVTERLPKAERKSYWVCTNTGYQCQCRWTNNPFGMGESDEWSFSIFDIPQYQKVVAWRVLPQPYTPPKGEEDVDTD